MKTASTEILMTLYLSDVQTKIYLFIYNHYRKIHTICAFNPNKKGNNYHKPMNHYQNSLNEEKSVGSAYKRKKSDVTAQGQRSLCP